MLHEVVELVGALDDASIQLVVELLDGRDLLLKQGLPRLKGLEHLAEGARQGAKLIGALLLWGHDLRRF